MSGDYIIRSYNFFVNPIPYKRIRLERDWTFQSGAIEFLMNNSFDFDALYRHGIHYLSHKEEEEKLRQWAAADAVERRDMPKKEDDLPLLEHMKDVVKSWLAQDIEIREEYVNIPDSISGQPLEKRVPEQLNSYQVRLVHQTIKNEYPDVVARSKGHFVQLTAPAKASKETERQREERYRLQDVQNARELSWIVEALSGGDITGMPDRFFEAMLRDHLEDKAKQEAILTYKSKLQKKLSGRPRVLVGHNCFGDVVNLYKCFFGDLPARFEDFSAAIHAKFPGLIDTKYLATADFRHGTSLEDVNRRMMKHEKRPKIVVPPEFSRYADEDLFHEAGFDAFITARALVKLSARMWREQKHEKADNSFLETTLVQPRSQKGQPDADDSDGDVSFESARDASVEEIDEQTEGRVVAIKKNSAMVNNKFASLSLDDTGDEAVGVKQHARKSETVAEPVVMMPDFYRHEFWRLLGNKLQTNPTEEGFCELKATER